MPFGVDTEYDSLPAAGTAPGGGGMRRDDATLMKPARIARVPLTLVCYQRNVSGLTIPPNVRMLPGLGHASHRSLLTAADLVVTPTTAPAHPSGHSVVVEATSLGRATLTTDSPAMRSYVEDTVTGALVRPGDPDLMARSM